MVIGITGGVGSGKSTALELIKDSKDACILRTDDIASELMDTVLLERLSAAFGRELRGSDGRLDKKLYSELIYSDPANTALSDRIVHPAVWERVRKLIREAEDKDLPVFVETALPGPEFKEICDYVMAFITPDKLREERLSESRGYTREHFDAIKRRQLDHKGYEAYADIVINNNGSKEDLKRRVLDEIDDIYKSCKREQR